MEVAYAPGEPMVMWFRIYGVNETAPKTVVPLKHCILIPSRGLFDTLGDRFDTLGYHFDTLGDHLIRVDTLEYRFDTLGDHLDTHGDHFDPLGDHFDTPPVVGATRARSENGLGFGGARSEKNGHLVQSVSCMYRR